MFGRTVFAIAVAVAALVFVRFLLKQEGLAKGASQPLVGTWKLIDEQTMLSDGTVISNRDSSTPLGLLVYDDTGHVAAQLFRPNTAKGMALSDLNSIRGGNGRWDYESYFGTYALDTAGETITCHVEAALPDESTGEYFVQQFSITDRKLTTRSHSFRSDGTAAIHVLVWSRLN
jgi:lipocalin-like protein